MSELIVRFQALNEYASQCFDVSMDRYQKGFIALNRIREEKLFLAGGYSDWKSYLNDFLAYKGMGRAIAYRNLHTVRLASSSGFSDDDISEIGLYAIRPYFEAGAHGPIRDYNRITGEILSVPPLLEEKLPEGDSLNERYGAYVKSVVNDGDPAYVTRQNLQAEMGGVEIRFWPTYDFNNNVTSLTWTSIVDGITTSGTLRNMPEDVKEELFEKIGYQS